MRIAFLTSHLTFRGSCVCLLDYAKYNEDILGNESLVVSPKSSIGNDNIAFRWISNRFPIHFYDSLTELEKFLIKENYQLVYVIKHGQHDGITFDTITFVVHCVFDMSTPHGSICAGVSETLARKFGSTIFVPHMISMTNHSTLTDLRVSLNIPTDALVFGRYGGMDTFNISFAQSVISSLVRSHPNIYFLLMNTPQWDTHSHIIHIPPITNVEFKKRFIKSCDAMLVPESLGHTFGLSIAEFQLFHKPIICFLDDKLWNRAHIDILGDQGIYFSTAKELTNCILNFKKGTLSRNSYSDYSPRRVMHKFKQIFILQDL